MKLKCVKCEKEAEYVFQGNSYCKEHMPKPKPKTKEDLPKQSKTYFASATGMRIS